MKNFSPLRIAVILLYFAFCSACGRPATPKVEQPPSNENTASDINFIGGGTQAPEVSSEEEAYRSPVLSGSPTPTSLNWAPTIDQAVRQANRNERIRVIVWFTNSSCHDCRTIERDVFENADVIAQSKDWIFVRVDTVRNQDRAEYYLHGAEPPAMVFLDKKGNEYRRHYGRISVEEMVTILQRWR